jgi:glycosyltransferase involved in cell wall biosynthesis
MTLDVLICTLGTDGIDRVATMNLPIVSNVNYIVSWQLQDTNALIPTSLLRDDIKIHKTQSKGLSINRNNAIAHSSADICLIADDDLIYTAEQLLSVTDTFNENPDIDIATFEYSGDDNKQYPTTSFNLANKEKGYYVSSAEIAFRRERIGDLRFNEHFGLGAPLLHACEEEVFIHQAICHGLRCQFFPITITHHQGETTGNRVLSPGVLMAQGAYIYIVYPSTALLRLPLFAWRSSRRGQTKMFPAMCHLWRGYIYGKRYFNHDGTVK